MRWTQVPLEFQGRVLTWGIIGAVVMRGFMIVVGVAAVQRFRGVILLFAAILLVSAVKLFFESDEPGTIRPHILNTLRSKHISWPPNLSSMFGRGIEPQYGHAHFKSAHRSDRRLRWRPFLHQGQKKEKHAHIQSRLAFFLS